MALVVEPQFKMGVELKNSKSYKVSDTEDLSMEMVTGSDIRYAISRGISFHNVVELGSSLYVYPILYKENRLEFDSVGACISLLGGGVLLGVYSSGIAFGLSIAKGCIPELVVGTKMFLLKNITMNTVIGQVRKTMVFRYTGMSSNLWLDTAHAVHGVRCDKSDFEKVLLRQAAMS